ncbi:hypothetical protein TH2_20263 [Thalassospira profundimaris WP0211]|nr:hypothetical protein TH2_20263 [Thalassospira profundimaris WP0211]
MEPAAIVGQLHAACCPVQQPGTQFLLQLSHNARSTPFLYAQALCRAAKAVHFGDPHKDHEVLKVLHMKKLIVSF